jgi:hypothetical protein
MNAQDTAALHRLEIVQGRVREEVMEVQRLHVFATRLAQAGACPNFGPGPRSGGEGMEKNVLLAMPAVEGHVC